MEKRPHKPTFAELKAELKTIVTAKRKLPAWCGPMPNYDRAVISEFAALLLTWLEEKQEC